MSFVADVQDTDVQSVAIFISGSEIKLDNDNTCWLSIIHTDFH